jgi:hypothetical protein
VPGCMPATPTPAPTAAPTISEAVMIMNHIFQVIFMLCISKTEFENRAPMGVDPTRSSALAEKPHLCLKSWSFGFSSLHGSVVSYCR